MQEEKSNPWVMNIFNTGFNSNDPDDDTFLLEKIGDYPGELPYQVEHTVEVTADIFKENANNEKSVEQKDYFSSEEQEKVSQEISAASNYVEHESEKNELESQTKPYQKAGLVEEEEFEHKPYVKSGLISDEDSVIKPYEKSGLIEKEPELSYQKSGLPENEFDLEESPPPPKSIWEIFEQEPSAVSAVESAVEKVKEPGEIPGQETEVGQGVAAEVVDEESVIDFPTEVKLAEFDKDEFAKIIDEDFRKKILDDIEKSKKRSTPEREIPAQELISAEEIKDLQKGLSTEEKIPEQTQFIEVELTAINLPHPSKIIADELKEKPDFSIPTDQDSSIKEKKIKKEKKARKNKPKKEDKVEKPMVSSDVSEDSPTEKPETIEEVTPANEQTKEEKKRRPALVFWLAGLVFILVLSALLWFLKPSFLFRKNHEIAQRKTERPKTQIQTIKKPKIPEKIQPPPNITESLKKQPAEATGKQITKVEPTQKTSENLIKQETQRDRKISQELRTPKVFSPAMQRVEKDKTTRLAPTPSKTYQPKENLALKTHKETAPIIEIIPQKEYSVELFSTFDSEEANYFLSLLNKKQISAYIKIQKIRNANLYKVRVGNFKNVDEAREFAKQYGFKNVWIDRIR